MTLFLLILGSCAFLLLGLYIHKNSQNSYSRVYILRHGVRTQGEIIELKLYVLDLLYRLPVVRFKNTKGAILTYTSGSKAPVSEFRKGAVVEVCYVPTAPDQFVIVSGLDVLVESKTKLPSHPYRLAKGQERRASPTDKPKWR